MKQLLNMVKKARGISFKLPASCFCHRTSSPQLLTSIFPLPTSIFLIVLALSGCTSKTFDTEEALWVHLKEEKNGYIHQKLVNGITYNIIYRPTDLLVKQELPKNATQHTIDSLRNKYGQYLYFNLSMAANNRELLSNVAGNKNQFGAMVNQLAFGMGDKVHLYTSKKDTIPLLDYIYPRMYGMSNSTTMMLVYPRDEKITNEKYINISIEDIGLFTGEVTFKILVAPLKNEPKLKF
ncbi:hypothetical protein [Leptobacterium sp. I13]|uniref:hypothetical protein n=1 Tax=Leptobacterium meishanense TaxID=3128904 RepID=UPI0030EEBAF3